MQQSAVLKVLRRLEAAEGYLELEMPGHAMSELDAIEEAGPFEASITLLKGEAFKSQEKYEEAIAALQKAAQMIPAPHNRRAWQSLVECYRLGGREEMAKLVETFANMAPAAPRIIQPVVNISITIQTPIDMNELEAAEGMAESDEMETDEQNFRSDETDMEWYDDETYDSEN
ncbi:MAG: tetratricopeptide repeat protein [Planctomycetaceae bacterium]